MIDKSILLLMYLQLVILEFCGLGRSLNKVVCGIILVRILFAKGKLWKTGYICAGLLSCIFALNLFAGEEFVFSNAKSTFLMLLYPIIYTYYIVFLCKNKSYILDECFDKCFWLFNFTMIVNIVVMLIQIFIPYSIEAVVDEAYVISYYEDTISGLFQYASTHVVCLFTVFICLYNISYIKKMGTRNLKSILVVYIFIIVFVSYYIAINNNNKALFLLLPLIIFLYWAAGKMDVGRKIVYILGVGLLLFLMIKIGYTFISSVQMFFDDNIFNLLKMIQNANGLGSHAKGSNERIAIIGYALALPRVWLFGTGFGSTGIYSSGYHGFYHFGQADFGSVLLLGGIWFSLLIFIYYYKSFMSIIDPVCVKNKKLLKSIVCMILLSTAIYTQCYTRTSVMQVLLLIIFTFRESVTYEKRNQGRLR